MSVGPSSSPQSLAPARFVFFALRATVATSKPVLALVVPGSAAVLAERGKCPFCHPAAGQDLEGMRIALGDDLHGHPRRRGPGDEFAGASGIGPDQADASAGAVLDRGGGDHHGQDQPGHVDCDVPLAAWHRARTPTYQTFTKGYRLSPTPDDADKGLRATSATRSVWPAGRRRHRDLPRSGVKRPAPLSRPQETGG